MTAQCSPPAAEALLAWYDTYARVLPWRVSPHDWRAGLRPDPYHIWLSEVMLQQTTVAAVRGYFERFLHAWPTVGALAMASDADVMAAWAGLGYYARARNLLACAREVHTHYGGRFPDTLASLRALPGIGPYTASAIAAIAFDQPETVVDGNVERVMARLHALHTPLPQAKPALTALAAQLTPRARPGDYAQAVMDLGATICTPRSPACPRCPWQERCLAHAQGIAPTLPRKQPKVARPTRKGQMWLARIGDALLLEQRPEKGLLGGMLGVPGDAWDGQGRAEPPLTAQWHDCGEISHVFSHFKLEARIFAAWVPQITALETQDQAALRQLLKRETAPRGTPPARPEQAARAHVDAQAQSFPQFRLVSYDETFRPDDLPSVMRKALRGAAPFLT